MNNFFRKRWFIVFWWLSQNEPYDICYWSFNISSTWNIRFVAYVGTDDTNVNFKGHMSPKIYYSNHIFVQQNFKNDSVFSWTVYAYRRYCDVKVFVTTDLRNFLRHFAQWVDTKFQTFFSFKATFCQNYEEIFYTINSSQ